MPPSSPTSSPEQPIALSRAPEATSKRLPQARVRCATPPAMTARATPSSVPLVTQIASSQYSSTTSVSGRVHRATQRSMASVPPVPLPVRPALALPISAYPVTAHWREDSSTLISAIAIALSTQPPMSKMRITWFASGARIQHASSATPKTPLFASAVLRVSTCMRASAFLAAPKAGRQTTTALLASSSPSMISASCRSLSS